MHKQKVTTLGWRKLHLTKSDWDGADNWPRKRLWLGRDFERQAVRIPSKNWPKPTLHRHHPRREKPCRTGYTTWYHTWSKYRLRAIIWRLLLWRLVSSVFVRVEPFWTTDLHVDRFHENQGTEFTVKWYYILMGDTEKLRSVTSWNKQKTS